jgi:hypothetical protein
MRNMSFALTKEQIRNQTKTVTRRKGWRFLKPGNLIQPVEKCMGFKRGERIKKIGGPIRIVSVRRESLWDINLDELAMEGFPHEPETMTFIEMYCEANGGDHCQDVNRIEFEYTEPIP